MVNAVRIIASCLFLVAALAAWQEAQSEFRFRVKIPKAVAAEEASRLAGNDQAPPPVLMMQGVENTANQGMTIEVRAESQPGAEEAAPILAVTGLVGASNVAPGSSPGEIDLPVPLNETAARFLANKSEVRLILKIKTEGPLGKSFKIKNVFFQLPKHTTAKIH